MPEIKIAAGPNGQLGVAVSEDIAGNLALVLGFIELGKTALIDQAKQNERRVQPVYELPQGLL